MTIEAGPRRIKLKMNRMRCIFFYNGRFGVNTEGHGHEILATYSICVLLGSTVHSHYVSLLLMISHWFLCVHIQRFYRLLCHCMTLVSGHCLLSQLATVTWRSLGPFPGSYITPTRNLLLCSLPRRFSK